MLREFQVALSAQHKTQTPDIAQSMRDIEAPRSANRDLSTHMITDAGTTELKRDLYTTKRHRVQTRRNRGQCARMTHMVALPLNVRLSKRASTYDNVLH